MRFERLATTSLDTSLHEAIEINVDIKVDAIQCEEFSSFSVYISKTTNWDNCIWNDKIIIIIKKN